MMHSKIYRRRRTFIVWQIVVLLFALLYEHVVGRGNNAFFVLVYSLWNTLSYGWLFLSEMKQAPDFHPFQVLTLSSIMFIGLNGLSLSFKLIANEPIIYYGQMVDDIVYLGIIYLSLEHILLYIVFFYFEKKRDLQGKTPKLLESIKSTNVDYYEWAKKIYIIIWSLRLLKIIVPLGAIGSAIDAFANDGYHISLLLFLFAYLKDSSRKKCIQYHWAVIVIEVFLALGHGMKEEIIRPFIPYLVYCILAYKANVLKLSPKFIARIAVLGVFVVGFVFPYISIFRSISVQTGKEWSDISVTETLSAYVDYVLGNPKYHDDEGRGAEYLASRAGSIVYNSWAIDYTKSNGAEPAFFAYCAIAAVPRVVWPGKPPMLVGGMIDHLINGDAAWLVPGDISEYGNSATLGFIGASYLSFGFWGAMLHVLLVAVFLSLLWQFIRKRLHYNPLSILVLMNMLFLVLKDFEAFQDCGVGFIATNTAYALIVLAFDKYFRKYA